MENEPKLRLNINDSEFEATRDNTSLYTFLGKAGLNLSMYNHIFCKTEDEDGVARGFYLWQHYEVYPEIVEFMAEHSYPAHLNMIEVPDFDKDAFDRAIEASTDFDTLPEEWQ